MIASPCTISPEEQAALNQIAGAMPWLLPTVHQVGGKMFDSADTLTARGFMVFAAITEDDHLFYRALPPRGWSRELHGRFLVLKDQAGAIRGRAYLRLGAHVRCAYVKFER